VKDHECPVKVSADKVTLDGDLCIPSGARGLVVFSHGSGSSRHSLETGMLPANCVKLD